MTLLPLSICCAALVALFAAPAQAQTPPPAQPRRAERTRPRYPANLPPAETRRSGGASVLTGELSRIGRDGVALPMAADTLRDRFGVATFNTEGDATVRLPVLIRRVAGANPAAMKAGGADVLAQIGGFSVAFVAPADLQRVAALPGVASVTPFRVSRLPIPPLRTAASQVPVSRGQATVPPVAAPSAATFRTGGLTGKGVAVAIADSGIDYRHDDFRNADGTTRLLAIWDVFDNSFQKSGGKIGSEPPYTTDDGTPVGTVYTREQINTALRGKTPLPTRDGVGHGTACAGIAAGNGLAAGANAKAFAGIAPDATIIAIKIAEPKGGVNAGAGILGAKWAMDLAAANAMPCVVNMSYGGHGSAHNGASAEEQAVNELTGKNKPGVAICVAAGNENQFNFYGEGTFGARREGQQDIESEPLLLNVRRAAQITAYFDARDDWGMLIEGINAKTLRDLSDPDRSVIAQLLPTPAKTATGRTVRVDLLGTKGNTLQPASAEELEELLTPSAEIADPNDPSVHSLTFVLQPGEYALYGFAASPKVASGTFGVYVPDFDAAAFTRGATHSALIGSPGNAASAITVGSYDFRATWQTKNNQTTRYNIVPGSLSNYSSPGYRRDGFIKPDVSAPGRYAISPLAPGSEMGEGALKSAAMTTADGKHFAWQGTSAATPYVTGVIALMLQKNPRLDAAQILDILHRSAKADPFTGAVPNRQWGYGKINPEAALAATPAVSKK